MKHLHQLFVISLALLFVGCYDDMPCEQNFPVVRLVYANYNPFDSLLINKSFFDAYTSVQVKGTKVQIQETTNDSTPYFTKLNDTLEIQFYNYNRFDFPLRANADSIEIELKRKSGLIEHFKVKYKRNLWLCSKRNNRYIMNFYDLQYSGRIDMSRMEYSKINDSTIVDEDVHTYQTCYIIDTIR
jgi:hypothetical protein